MTTNSEAFKAALNHVKTSYHSRVIETHPGEVNNVAILSLPPGDMMVLKVANKYNQNNEARVLRYMADASESNEPQPLLLPNLQEENNLPPYLLISHIPGEVLPEKEVRALTLEERKELGKAIARFALWETRLDIATFKASVDNPRGGSWRNWDQWFDERLSLINRKEFPTLTGIAEDIVSLRHLHYPESFEKYANQVIHGDLRLPNLVLRSSAHGRKLAGIIDFETMRRGDMAEELRSLHLLGELAITACNQELVANGHPAVHPDKIKFWCVGRWIASILWQLAHDRPDSDEYTTVVQRLTSEYPEADWSELSRLP